jgi:hypothetical protein
MVFHSVERFPDEQNPPPEPFAQSQASAALPKMRGAQSPNRAFRIGAK